MNLASKNVLINFSQNVFRHRPQKFLKCYYSQQNLLKPRHYLEPSDVSPDEIKIMFHTAGVFKTATKEELNILERKKVLCLLHDPCWKIHTWLHEAIKLLSMDINTIIYPKWDSINNVQDIGRMLSLTSDIIFCQGEKHLTARTFAEGATVPVINLSFCRFTALPALSDLMTLQEYFDKLEGLTVACIGVPCPFIYTYLEICPWFKIHVKFLSINRTINSPIWLDLKKKNKIYSEYLTEADNLKDVISDAHVIITTKLPQGEDILITKEDLDEHANEKWVFFHSLPRSNEVEEEVFQSDRNLIWNSFINSKYVCAAVIWHFMGITDQTLESRREKFKEKIAKTVKSNVN